MKITNLKVPSSYTIESPSNPDNRLILDCEYEISPNETGFVLKWVLNDIPIYQWIPSGIPYAVGNFKGKIDTNYTVSRDKHYKHRALLITKPTWNMTGTYGCDVQTFQGKDKQYAHLQIIGKFTGYLSTSSQSLFLFRFVFFFICNDVECVHLYKSRLHIQNTSGFYVLRLNSRVPTTFSETTQRTQNKAIK